ncbi:TolB family protein [Chengkuizengella axinellae]|uniref:Uncharacterized protein n=1 Tax=Chengkuizengella axinellae TaxID=3064388 RepID=A0ABT9IZ29_9BACL|nr:hypothetical protein [Chengkuizengella sp. 2205SS18-9]MDP5274613.1 hypothetical protein [Chengkuizengella sp. 2205SS18-9]
MRFNLVIILIICSILLTSCSKQTSIKLPYFSDEPITTPITFEEGVISTDDTEWAFTFTPDGSKIYIQRGTAGLATLYKSEYVDGKWTEPVLFTFPTQENIHFIRLVEPFISPDGSKFFFVSEGDGMEGTDLWVSENIDGTWGEPTILEILNSPRNEYFPSVSNNGNLYFQSNRQGTSGSYDLFVSKFIDGEYTQPVQLGEEINTSGVEQSPFITPDESYLIFSRDGAFYISYNTEGKWSEAELLTGEPLNGLFGSRYSPYVSPDQKYFFYADGDIHQVDVSVIGLNNK